MTVLRSREIRPSSTPVATPKTTRPRAEKDEEKPNVVYVEPVTPDKTLAAGNSNIVSGFGSRGGGSALVLGTGTMPRRSARLSTKVGTGSIEVVTSRKRKKVEEDISFDETNLETRGLDFKSSALTPDTSSGVDDQLSRNLGVKTVNSCGKGKRRISMEMKSLDLESFGKNDVVEKEVLSLRSGKRVTKIEMNDDKRGSSAGNLLGGSENTKESGDIRVKIGSVGEYGNVVGGGVIEKRFTRGEKGKGIVGSEDLKKSGSVPVNFEPVDGVGDAIKLPRSIDLKEVVQGKGTVRIEDAGRMTRGRRASQEEKGKMKVVEDSDSSSDESSCSESETENLNENSVSGTAHSAENVVMPEEVQVREMHANVNANDARRVSRDRHRNIARRIASRFAHFSAQEEQGNNDINGAGGGEIPHPDAEEDSRVEDWPGPFSTAMKIIKDRGNKTGGRHAASSAKSEAVELNWVPSKNKEDLCKNQNRLPPPSLQDKCLSILAKHADAIASLDGVPDALRHKISWFLCDNRRMDTHFLELLLHGTPTEIRLRDCSWLSEEQFTNAFEGCDASKLMVLQFDQCGCCMPDYALSGALARFPNSLPALTTISLKGAYRLTDDGLRTLVSAAPCLKSVDIGQCPMLTSDGIKDLASSLQSVLRELYLDNSNGIDAMHILRALQKLKNLEVLSLAGIETVTDDFVIEVVLVHGCRMKELILADCLELTDKSLEVIGLTCSGLRAIDLTNLCQLTNKSICHLANGCQAIQMLRLCRNVFSDEAVAAYLDVRGACLKDLSLNNIIQVSNHTALSLARNCRNLRNLDLSWCRNLTSEALGLIVDSCSSLELLKLFGCTQVTTVFLNGHSNEQVKLIGLKMTPVFKHIDVPDFLLGPLRYSAAAS